MLESADDADLLARYVRDRAEDAFAELVRRYIGLVYHAALRQGDCDSRTAEDVTQRVFILLARKASALTAHRTIAGWLHTSTRLVFSEVRRAERRRRIREQRAYTMQLTLSDGAREADWEELRPIIDETLSELDHRDREIVLLRFFANLPFTQIGAQLSVSENGARMRLERALERLRALVARRGITSTAAAMAMALETQATIALAPAGLAVSVTSTALSLETAPAMTAGLAGITALMSSMKSSVAVGAAVLLATALGVATHSIQSHRRATAALSESNREFAELTASKRDVENELRLTEQATADLRRQLEQTRTAQAASSAAGAAETPAAPVWDPAEQGRNFMTRHPSVRRAIEAYARARVHYRYAGVYAELGLRADQIDEFQRLLSGRLSMGAQGSDGLYSNRWLSLVSAGPSPISDEYKERMRALLGEEGIKKLGQYGLTVPARELASKVAGELWSTAAPLTPQQADHLVRIFTQQRSNRASMPGSRVPGYDWDRILVEAGGLLSETQLAVLKGMQAREQFNQAINRGPPPNWATEKGGTAK